MAESLPSAGSQAQSEYQKVFQAAKKLYDDGEHKEAIIRFLEALNLSKITAEISEANLYIALSYYALGERDKSVNYLRKLFELTPEKEIEALNFPAGFVGLYYQLKNEAAKQGIPKPEVKDKGKIEEKKTEPVKKAGEEERKPGAISGKAEPEVQVKKKGKFPWLIVGGLVVAAGVVLYFVLGKKKDSGSNQGSVSVTSTPLGTKVYLDGTDTGQTTACTLNNVSAGAHTVKLTKDGYADFQQSVTVTAGQTAVVNAALTANIISVTSPAAGTTWMIGTTNDIRWQMDSGALAEMQKAKSASQERTRPAKSSGRLTGVARTDHGAAQAARRDFPAQSSSSLAIIKVKIELYKGGTLNALIIAEANNNGVYSWAATQPSVSGSDYRIRISCSTDPSIYGESAAFTLSTGTIMVDSPSSGSIWNQGSAYDIRWTSTASGNVRIDLYKGTSALQTIAADTSNDGVHNWTIPPALTDGADYKIRISIISNSNIFGESGYFKIGGGTTYEFVLKWGSQGSGDGQFSSPQDVAIDSLGYVYVADSYNHRIQKFSSDGNFITKWGTYGSEDGQFAQPFGMAIDSSGFVYVTDYNNRRIQKFTANGSFVTKWGSAGTGDIQFNGPRKIAVDSSNNVYVSDGNNSRIQKFTSDGSFVAKWGGFGSGDGQFNIPTGIAVDSSGYVFVAEQQNARIQKFSSTGSFIVKWGNSGSGDGGFSGIEGLARDSSDFIYVVDTSHNRIQKFTRDGGFVTKWGNPGFLPGSEDGQFSGPWGVAIDASGFVFVADTGNHRIQKFRKTTQTVQATWVAYTSIGTRINGSGSSRPPQLFFGPAKERSGEAASTPPRKSPEFEFR